MQEISPHAQVANIPPTWQLPLSRKTSSQEIQAFPSTETLTTEVSISKAPAEEPVVEYTRAQPTTSSQNVQPKFTEADLGALSDKIIAAKKRMWGILLPLAGIATVVSLVCAIRLFDLEHLDKDIALVQGALAIFAGMIAIKNGLEAHTTWNKMKTIRRRVSAASAPT